MQETEPYARLSLWLLPVGVIAAPLVGGALGASALAAGAVGAAVTWFVIGCVLAVSCVFGIVQARRARRSDRMHAAREARSRGSQGPPAAR